jgi:hypothetical protein
MSCWLGGGGYAQPNPLGAYPWSASAAAKAVGVHFLFDRAIILL